MTNKTILEAQIGTLLASMGEMQKLADTYFEENGGYVERDTNAAVMPDSHEDVWNTYSECIEILWEQIKSLRAQAAAEQPTKEALQPVEEQAPRTGELSVEDWKKAWQRRFIDTKTMPVEVLNALEMARHALIEMNLGITHWHKEAAEKHYKSWYYATDQALYDVIKKYGG